MAGKNCTTLIVLFIIIAAIIPQILFSQESENINLFSEHFWAWDKVNDFDLFPIESENEFLVLATGNTGFALVEFVWRDSIDLVFNHHVGFNVKSIEVLNSLVIVGGNDALSIYDVSETNNPIELSRINVAPYDVDLICVINDTLLYYGDTNLDEIKCLNISNPSNPVELSSFSVDAPYFRQVVNDSILVSCGEPSTKIYDITNPAVPHLLAQLPSYTIAKNCAIYDSIMAIGNGEELRLYNITDCSTPVLINSYSSDMIPQGWYNNELHLIDNDSIYVYSYENENGLEYVFRFEKGRYNSEIHDYKVFEEHSYLVMEYDRKSPVFPFVLNFMYQIDNPGPAINPFSRFTSSGLLRKSIRKDNFIFVISANHEWRILEILDNNEIIEHTSWVRGGLGWNDVHIDAVANGNSLYFIDFSEFSEMEFFGSLNISDPLNPVYNNDDILSFPEQENSLFLYGDSVLTCRNDVDVDIMIWGIFDLIENDWSSILLFDIESNIQIAHSFGIFNQHLITTIAPHTYDRNGFFTLDISGGEHVFDEFNSFYETSGPSLGFDIRESSNHLFLCSGDNGIEVVDINDMDNPTLSNSIPSGGYAKYIQLVNNYAFVVNEDIGLEVYNITDVSEPELTGWFYDVGVFNHVEVVDSVAQLTSDRHFYLLDCINAMGGTSNVEDELETVVPQEHIIYPPYPNPFNSSAQVKVELDSPSRVTIKAYDILGRELYREIKFLHQGNHTVPLDLKGLTTSGPILVRVQTKKSSQVYKLYRLE